MTSRTQQNTTLVVATAAIFAAGLPRIAESKAEISYAVGTAVPPSDEPHHDQDKEFSTAPAVAQAVVASSLTMTATSKVIRTGGWVAFKLT